jgi:hypothetical protein
MTIQEAIKSGRSFRRKLWPESLGYMLVDEFRVFAWKSLFNEFGHHKEVTLTPKDVLADDWELAGEVTRNAVAPNPINELAKVFEADARGSRYCPHEVAQDASDKGDK